MRTRILLSIITVISLSACKKHDYCPEPPPPPTATTCDLMQSTVNGYTDMEPNASQFRKEYDAATGKVRKVVAGIYSLYLADSIALLLQYNGDHVYFVSEQKPADTVLIATFDGANHLTELRVGNTSNQTLYQWYEPLTSFSYSDGKLTKITRQIDENFGDAFHLSYDQHGNVVRIFDNSNDSNAGVFYTYDLAMKATAQFYPDAFGTDNLNNSVYLADFLGWLPDLDGVNKRTSFKNIFNDEDTTDNEPGYVFNNTQLSGHVYDSEGKLLSYKIAESQITYSNNWHCTAVKAPN